MDWFLWVLVGWWTFSAFVTIAYIGEPRKATTPSTAAVSLAIYLVLGAGLLVTR